MDEEVEKELAIELNVKNDDGWNDKHKDNRNWYFLFGSSDTNIHTIHLSIVLNTDRKFFIDTMWDWYKHKVAYEVSDW